MASPKKKPAPAPEYTAEIWPIDKLIPYEVNPRVITDKAVDAVAASIKAFGFRNPIVVDEHGVVVNGHTRRAAALKLGLKQVPVHVARGLSQEQVRAFRIADNRVAEETEWDKDLLAIEVGELMEADFDLPVLGFSEDELSALFRGAFDPTLDPEKATGQVSDGDVDKAKVKLAKVDKKQDIIEVTCPHCAETYGLNRADIS